MFEELGAAIDQLDIPADGAALAAVVGLRDRLDARISDAVAAHDRAGLWELDGATSMTAWLTDRAAMPRARAAATVSRARKLARLPVTAGAWRDGVLSSGQVEAIAANLDADTLALFADHEAVMMPTLVHLSVRDVATAMAAWRECATADRDPKPEPAQALYLSPTLGGRWRLDANLGPETGELLATALRLTQSPDVEGEPARSPATRRGGRPRRHLPALPGPPAHPPRWPPPAPPQRHPRHRALSQPAPPPVPPAVDGTRLDRTTTDRLLCDAALHRVLTQGRSAILDYGTATRAIPAPLYNALVLRDGHCRFPGCDRPHNWCEGHHIQPWQHGGPTNLANLVLLCSRHHHLLHRPGWHTKLLPDTTLEITDPTGRVRTSHPPAARRAPPPPLRE